MATDQRLKDELVRLMEMTVEAVKKDAERYNDPLLDSAWRILLAAAGAFEEGMTSTGLLRAVVARFAAGRLEKEIVAAVSPPGRKKTAAVSNTIHNMVETINANMDEHTAGQEKACVAGLLMASTILLADAATAERFSKCLKAFVKRENFILEQKNRPERN
jgi:hypothetical protein